MSYYRNQLEAWLRTISITTDRVLDLGGASNPVKKRVKAFDVKEIVYLDNGAEGAKESYIKFDINLPWHEQLVDYGADLRVQPLALDQSRKIFEFGAVFCLEVFEYVWNPVQAMQNIYEMMSPDSIAYISFPSIYPVHQPVEIDYLRYTKEAILKYLQLFGFINIEILPRQATKGILSLQTFYQEEGMHPVRHSALPYDIGYLVTARKLTL